MNNRPKASLASNWIGQGSSGGQQRRLIRALRMSHLVMGFDRRNLALGSLGMGTFSAAAALAVGWTSPAMAQDAVCVDPATGQVITAQAAAAAAAAGNQVICGPGAVASAPGAIAIGSAASSTAGDAVAIGTNAQVTGGTVNQTNGAERAIAIGINSRATSPSSIAIGNGAITQNTSNGTSTPASAIAIGTGATAMGNRTIAIGAQTGMGGQGYDNVAVGISSGQNVRPVAATANGGTAVNATGNVAYGLSSGNNVTGGGNLAIGSSAGNNVGPLTDPATGPGSPYCLFPTFYCYGGAGNGINNTAIGPAAANSVQGSQNIGLGFRAGSFTTGNNNIATGQLAGFTVNGSGNAGIGSLAGAYLTGHLNTAIGNAAGGNVTGDRNLATGNGAGAGVTGSRNVASGNNAGTFVSGNDNLAEGNTSGAGVTGSRNIASGSHAGERVSGDENVAHGSEAGIYRSGSRNIAMGSSAGTGVTRDLTTGTITDSNGAIIDPLAPPAYAANDTVAVGTKAVVTADRAIAIGTGSQALGVQSISIGTGNIVRGENSGAIGDPTVITGSGSYAFGNNNTVNANNAFVLGNNVTVAAGLDGAVVLGANSTVAAPVGTSSGTIAGTTFNYAGTAPVATVSVGASDAERTVTNVAAGRVDATSTDAVNGSQLYAVNSAAEDAILQAQGNTAALGGGAAYDPATNTYTAPSYATSTGTYTNVGDALTAGNTQTNTLGQSVAAGMGGTSSYDPATGQVTTALSVGGSSYTNVNDALNAVSTVAGAGWNVATSGPGSTTANIGPNGTVTFAGDANVTVTQTGVDDAGQVNVALNPDISLTSVTTGNTVMNTSGLSVAGGPNGTVALTGTGLDNGGNTITNVAAGVNGTDAVNVGQLQAATLAGNNADESAVKYDWTDLDGDGVVDPGEVDYSRATLAGTNGTTLSNVAPGAINAASTEAINGSQIFANQQSVANALGGGTVVNANGTLSAPSYVTSTGTYTNVGDALTAGNTQTNTLGQSVAAGMGGASSYDPATGQVTTALSVGGSSYTNVNDALNAVSTVAGAGWNVAATGPGSTTANIGPNGTVTFAGDANLTVTQTGTDDAGQVNVALNPDISLTSVTTGNTVMNTSGLSVAGGPNGTVALTGTGLDNGGNTITNVAAGVNGTDAVNVGQLQAATLAGNNADERAVKYDWTDLDGDGVVDPGEVDYSRATLAGTNGTTLSNVAPGAINAASTEAINGSQIFANQQSVANALGGGTVVNANGTLSAPSYVTSTGTYTNVGDALTAANTQTNTLGQSVAAGMGGRSSYDPATGQVTTALNVAGTSYADVNSALNAVSTTANAGWNVTTGATGTGIANGTTVANVAPGATHTITAGDNIVASQNGTEVQLAVNPNLAVTSVTTGNTVMSSTGVSVAGGPGGTVALTGRGLDNGGNTITNVAAGVNATDAVNVGQLTAVSQQVTTNSQSIAALDDRVTVQGQTVAAGLGGGSSYDPATGAVTTQLAVAGATYSNVNDAINAISATANAGWNIQANGGPATNVPSNGTLNVASGSNVAVSLSGNQLTVAVVDNPTFAGTVTAAGGLVVALGQRVDMGGNVVRNVAPGQVAAGSTDAVNGGQLHQVQQVAANSVQYDNSSRTSVTFNPGGNAAVLHNVAAGVAPTDAVNVAQLNSGLGNTLSLAQLYTDQQIAGLSFDLTEARSDLNAGTAGALAAAALPQAFEPGKGMVAFGAGTYAGESAFALGVSRVLDDGKTVIKAGATYNTRSEAGANVGVGFQF